MTPTPTQKAQLKFGAAKALALTVATSGGDPLSISVRSLADGLGDLSEALRQIYKLLEKIDKQTSPKGFS